MKDKWQELSTRLWVQGNRFFAQTEGIENGRPERTSMPERDLFGELAHMLLMLGIVFLVLLVLLWLSKRFLAHRMDQVSNEGNIKLIERHTLSMKSTLYLVEVAGENWLIGESPTTLTAFGKVDLKEEAGEE